MSVLGFLQNEMSSFLYGKIAYYLCDQFSKLGIPFHCVQDCSHLMDSDILVIFYDYLVNHMEKDPEYHNKYVKKFILVEIEPQINMDQWYRKAFLENKCLSIITFNKKEGEWLKQNYKIPTFIVYHGYSEREDAVKGSKLYEEEYDVLMPGCENSEGRRRVIASLREAGLTVNTKFLINEELEKAIKKSKIYAYYPASHEHGHFATQRILFSINKGACIVAVKSFDEELEKYYNPLLITCDRHNFVVKCKEVVQTGQWKEMKQFAYTKFKEYDAFQNFKDSGLFEYLKELIQ